MITELIKGIWLCYLRVVSYVLLVAVGLAQRLYQSLQPLLAPLLNVINDIDPDDVNIATINDQAFSSVFSVGIFSWKVTEAVLEVILKPFGDYVEDLEGMADKLKKDFRKPEVPAEPRKARPEADDEKEKI